MLLHRTAWVALVSLFVLVVVGATVRVTGSGLGCPDWPTCWGCLIPPTSVDQIDVDRLDIEKFKRHAIKKGIDPDTITRETVLDSFDPVHTWIEFGNRLTSLPLGFSTLLLALLSFRAPRFRGTVILLAWLSLVDVLANAVMGAIVVRSGLQPGIITLHMALAFLLIMLLDSVVWLTRPGSSETTTPATSASQTDRRLLFVSLIFFGCLFAEGLLGSQLREQTDEMSHAVGGLARSEWLGQLSATWIYKIHRTFSWSLLLTSGLMLAWSGDQRRAGAREPKLIFALVILMMLMGVILGHISIFAVVQVAHVGTTAVLLALTWHWIMRLWSARASARVSAR
jgi:cytochrome c oxidase assembly protein subunit 15